MDADGLRSAIAQTFDNVPMQIMEKQQISPANLTGRSTAFLRTFQPSLATIDGSKKEVLALGIFFVNGSIEPQVIWKLIGEILDQDFMVISRASRARRGATVWTGFVVVTNLAAVVAPALIGEDFANVFTSWREIVRCGLGLWGHRIVSLGTIEYEPHSNFHC